MEGLTLQQQKEIFGQHKIIPSAYEGIILKALSYFPELKSQHIQFRLKKNHIRLYSAMPSVSSVFRSRRHRKYIITLREDASPPLTMALFKNLPEEAQLGILGHELAHIMQYRSYNSSKLLRVISEYLIPSFRKKFEKAADKKTIEHGLGKALHAFASYIRSIPGYVKKRPELNQDYLKPEEIVRILKASVNMSTR